MSFDKHKLDITDAKNSLDRSLCPAIPNVALLKTRKIVCFSFAASVFIAQLIIFPSAL